LLLVDVEVLEKKKIELSPQVDIPTPPPLQEPVEDLKPPEVQYTHKQMLQAFGL